VKSTGRAIRLAALALGLAFALQPLGAQSGGGGQGGGGGSGGGAPGGGTGAPAPGAGRTTPNPGQPASQSGQLNQQSIQRPWFFSGKVVLDDGTPATGDVTIESVCGGVRRPEAHTDSRGRFSFEFGHNAAMLPDASISSGGFDRLGRGFPAGAARGGSDMLPTMGTGVRPGPTGCELRAVLAGYRSEALDLAGRQLMDNPDVGTIILHRLGQGMGTIVSATNLAAPRDAKKAYERGLASLKKQQWAEAQMHLERAVQVYPKYAAAWFGLGLAHDRQDRREEARRAFTQALEADPKYLQPYLPLATISIQEMRWQEAADLTARLLQLDPTEQAPVLLLNAVANVNLHNVDAAEKSARAAVQFDPTHRFPRAEYVLGIVLANRQEYAAATQLMRAYLERQPDAPDAELVRKQITDIERVAGAPQPVGAQPRP
jgi:Tfp pilus assembly protein PilF